MINETLQSQISALSLAEKLELIEWIAHDLATTEKANHLVGGQYDVWLPTQLTDASEYHPDDTPAKVGEL